MRWRPCFRQVPFPGAPKIRACQIIEELESCPRGIYGGALGYVDFTGNLDTCIAIRMAVKKNGTVYVQSGGRYRGGQRAGKRIRRVGQQGAL